jgi:hypothetical protein
MADALITDLEIAVLCDLLEGPGANLKAHKRSGRAATAATASPKRSAKSKPLRVTRRTRPRCLEPRAFDFSRPRRIWTVSERSHLPTLLGRVSLLPQKRTQ